MSSPPPSSPWTTSSPPNQSLSLLTNSLSISTQPQVMHPVTPISSSANVNVGIQVIGVVSPPTPAPSPTPKRMAEGFKGGDVWDDDSHEDMLVTGKGKGKARVEEVDEDVDMREDIIQSPTSPSFSNAPTSSLAQPLPTPESLIQAFKSLTPSSRFAFLAGLVGELHLNEALVVSRNVEPRLRRDFLRELPGELGLHCLSFVEDAKTLARAAQVSTHWNNLLQDEQTWKDMCSRHRFTGIISPIEYPELRTPVLMPSDRFGGRGVVGGGAEGERGSGEKGRTGGAGGKKSFKSQFKNAYLTESNWLTSGRLLASHIATDDGVVTSIALNDKYMLIGMATSKLHVFSAVKGSFRRSLVGHELGVWTVVLISPYDGSSTDKANAAIGRKGEGVVDEVDVEDGNGEVMTGDFESQTQSNRPTLGFSRLSRTGRRVVTTNSNGISTSSSNHDFSSSPILNPGNTARATYRDEGVARRASFNGPGLFGRVGAPVDITSSSNTTNQVPLPALRIRSSAYASGSGATGPGQRNRRNHVVEGGRTSTTRRPGEGTQRDSGTGITGLGFGARLGMGGGLDLGQVYQSQSQVDHPSSPNNTSTSSYNSSASNTANQNANSVANGLGVNIFPMPGNYPSSDTAHPHTGDHTTRPSNGTGPGNSTGNGSGNGNGSRRGNGNGNGKKGIPRVTKKMRQSDVCNSARGWVGLKRTLGVSAGCDKQVMVWDVDKGQLLHALPGHTSTIRCLKVLDRRPIAVSGSRDNSVRVWDIEKGECLHVLNGHTASVRCIEIAGNQIVSGSYDHTCRLWDADTGECLHVLRGHYHQIYAVAFDGERVVTGSLDSSVRIWSASTGDCIALLQGHTSLVGQLQLTGDILTTGGSDGRVIIFDLNSMTCVHRLCAHDNSVTCLQFNDRFVVSGGNDGRVKLWDARTGVFVRELTRPCDAIWRIAFREDRMVILCQRQGKTIMEVLTFRPQDVGVGRKVRKTG